MCFYYKYSIRIILILWISSNDYRGINASQALDDGMWGGDGMWEDDIFNYSLDMATHGSFEKNRKSNLRKAGRSNEQSILRNLSSWEEESNVWGSMHLEKELGVGWIPASYPNPKNDPGSCGISISDDESNHDVEDLSKLYFCDPDRVLSNRNFGRVISSIRKFNAIYGGSHDIDDPEIYSTSQNSRRWSINSADSSNERYLKYEDPMDDDYFGPIPHHSSQKRGSQKPDITVGIAIARKIDVTDILREYSLYSFEDEVDTINDAAEYFARYLLNLWWRRDTNLNIYSDTKDDDYDTKDGSNETSQHRLNLKPSGVLIFMAVEEQVCFVAAGNDVSYILPWWRLENIVDRMKTNLRDKSYGDALSIAIEEVATMLDAGPPTFSERAHDFLTRFGIIIVFSLMTFFMAIGGEYRDRQKRLKSAELKSQLNSIEEEKAKLLQYEYKTTECPICLEPFCGDQESIKSRSIEVGKYGIPCRGSDGLPIKLLRCGHIYDLSCWQAWVDTDYYGNSDKCPMCRQDIAGLQKKISESDISSQSSLDFQNDSMFSDDLSVDNDESETLISNARMSSFDNGMEYERSSQMPHYSYGSTWIAES